jgi:CubicO group peptidase (beta-lactamase class C family)
LIYTQDSLKVCLSEPGNSYKPWRDQLGNQGFRTLSLTMSGPPADPLYTAVMVKPASAFRAYSQTGLTQTQLLQTISEKAAEPEPLHPYILTATGCDDATRYAVAFRKQASKPVVCANLSAAQLKAEHDAQREAGNIPLWLDSFGNEDDIRYCGIWTPNVEHVAWSADASNEQGEERQQRFDAMVSVRARPSLVAMTPSGGLTRLFVDSVLEHGWQTRPFLSTEAMQSEMTAQAQAGRWPVRIGTAVVDGSQRYAAIFAKSDQLAQRSFRKQGAGGVPLDPANAAKAALIDTWMESYVKAHNIRGAAIAIVEGTRLVFTRGYNFAETGYANTEPTTLFRLASVSKTFCAIAAWKALLDDPKYSRNSKFQEILQLQPILTPLMPSLPPVANLAKVTVRHLLESCSGIDQNAMRDSMRQVRDETNDPQPVSAQTLARMVASRPMPGVPGGPTAYGRTDYFLLGMVAAKLSKTADFDAALKKLVLDPLKMTRTRSSSSLMENRKADEVMHHDPKLETARRIVPGHYGGENYDVFDGPGGISSAAVDVARLVAMLSCRTNNPILPAPILQEFLENAAAATLAGTDKGYHGFDAVMGSDPNFTARKGGSLPGVATGFSGTTGRRFIIMLRNSPPVEGASPAKWDVELNNLAKAVNWGNGDLFPQFGMPTLQT